MPMADSYRTLVANAGAAAITHIGLVDGAGTEISGGAYARKAVTWATPSTGRKAPNADLLFDIPAGATVAGWRGFTALSGGTNHGGFALTSESFPNGGTYTLQAANTYIDHTAA